MNLESKFNEKLPRAVILTGPTASGKTELSRQLAHKISIEVINADSRQIYVPLTVGTAKPDWHNEFAPHHLFDIFDKPIVLTVVEHRKMVVQKIHEIIERGNLPVIVGGSMFYVKSLLFPPRVFPKHLELFEVAAKLQKIPETERWAELCKIDPERANEINPNDTYRINRALHIWFEQKVKPSKCKPLFNPPCNLLFVCINPKIKALKDRIFQRLVQMLNLNNGLNDWVKEVEDLLNTPWERFWKQQGTIGYGEIALWIRNGRQADEKIGLIEEIRKKTIDYAKRQMCFWKSLRNTLQSYDIPILEAESGNDKKVVLSVTGFLEE